MGIKQGRPQGSAQFAGEASRERDHVTMPHMDTVKIAQRNDSPAAILRQSAMASQNLHA
ncbi:hypothetical protein MACH15_05990 [Maricaulis maris]|nr:hypothetical protein MACH15_05990 [Maricaulis maris]